MSYADPRWLEGRRKYWTRPDAYRFFKPGTPEAKMPGWLDPWATRVRAEEAAADEAHARAVAEQEEFERELLQLRWEVKKLKLEHELWCFEQKYSPDQPRDDRGRWVEDPHKGTADDAGKVGSEAAFDPNAPGWHHYQAGPNLVCAGGCAHEEMVDQLARYSLPGRDPSMPIEDEGRYPVHIPGTNLYVGDVDTRMENNGLTIENRTKEGHIFFDGIVIRQLTQAPDGAWYVTTHGLGNNVELGTNVVNQLVGPEVFNELDRQMRANIERHHGKGFLDLAKHRLVRGDSARAPHTLLGER